MCNPLGPHPPPPTMFRPSPDGRRSPVVRRAARPAAARIGRRHVGATCRLRLAPWLGRWYPADSIVPVPVHVAGPRRYGRAGVKQISLEQGLEVAFDAILGNRLALLCGAGLSMSSPSNLPSAAALAAEAKKKYAARYGSMRPPLPDGIEEQANFFFGRGELGTVYLRAFIDPHAFASHFNEGHAAVADLLLTGGVSTAVSTNVDTLIESAGQALFGHIHSGIDRETVAGLPLDVSPLLKIHGCWLRDQPNTVWAPAQLAANPVMDRVTGSTEWLRQRLFDKDLIIVGYFTDWDYLNGVLEKTLGEVRPSRVVVVDPGDPAWLAGKAPTFHALGTRASSEFLHVRVTGDAFLQALQVQFCRSFIRGAISAGSDAFERHHGQPPEPGWLEPAPADTPSLYWMRRDLEGVRPGQPARLREPPSAPVLGLTILQLLRAGATGDGPYWLLNGTKIRVLNSGNQLIRDLEVAYGRETPPLVAPDVVIAVGAEADPLPAHVVRSGTTPTVARGAPGRWLTRPDAVQELGL